MEYFKLISRNCTVMNELQLTLLGRLMFWRDFVARKEDECTRYVLSNDTMFGISKQVPMNIQELETLLKKYPKHHKHQIIEKYTSSLLELINELVKKHNEKMALSPPIAKKVEQA